MAKFNKVQNKDGRLQNKKMVRFKKILSNFLRCLEIGILLFLLYKSTGK